MCGNYEQKLHDCENELNRIQTWIISNSLDSNVRYLTAYAVIKASGTIEQALKQMLFDILTSGCTEEAKTYFTKQILKASFNPSPKKIINLLPNMSSNWQNSFKDRIDSTPEKAQLQSLVDLRNAMSHGNDITTSISDVITYYNSGKWILAQLYDVITNSST